MKDTLGKVVLALIIIALPASALAYHNQHSNRGQHHHGNPPPVVTPPPPPVIPPPVVPPPATPPPNSGEIVLNNVYNTFYGWPDNTPAGAVTTIQGVNGTAGGTGTFTDPITMATGFSLAGGKETDDYAAGTKFYDPNLRKYFVIGDTCGDGSSPQTEPCHVSEIKGTIQLDSWVGGQGLSSSGTLACEDTLTRVGVLIENPKSTYAVVVGPVYNGTCATQYGDVIVNG